MYESIGLIEIMFFSFKFFFPIGRLLTGSVPQSTNSQTMLKMGCDSAGGLEGLLEFDQSFIKKFIYKTVFIVVTPPKPVLELLDSSDEDIYVLAPPPRKESYRKTIRRKLVS